MALGLVGLYVLVVHRLALELSVVQELVLHLTAQLTQRQAALLKLKHSPVQLDQLGTAQLPMEVAIQAIVTKAQLFLVHTQ